MRQKSTALRDDIGSIIEIYQHHHLNSEDDEQEAGARRAMFEIARTVALRLSEQLNPNYGPIDLRPPDIAPWPNIVAQEIAS